MGADGHIDIWADRAVRRVFPDCDRLFDCLPNYYTHTLDGTVYHHCYWGTDKLVDYRDREDWHLPHIGARGLTPKQAQENQAVEERLREFTEWLDGNATGWEVWT